MVWHTVDKVKKIGADWVVYYSILTCCQKYNRVIQFTRKKRPTDKQIEDAINNKG